MGGQVLDYDAKTIRNEGISQGISQGKTMGQTELAAAIRKLKSGFSEADLIADGLDRATIDLAKECLM